MSRRSKMIAARDRERRAVERLQEEERLKQSFLELKSRVGGFAKSGDFDKSLIKKKLAQNEIRSKFGPRFNVDPVKSKPIGDIRRKEDPKYTGELLLRQNAAKDHYESMKLRIGQVGPKMGDQYLTDSDLQDQKKGLLRRRS